MKTINIKGKEYVTVNERLKEFRTNEIYKDFSLESEIIDLTADTITVKAVIKNNTGRIIATGLAQEIKNNPASIVNKTSFVENCETSAWGRALGNLGIGIDNSVASAEEVVNAIAKKYIPQEKSHQQIILEAIKDKDIKSDEIVDFIDNVLNQKDKKANDLSEEDFDKLLKFIESKKQKEVVL